MPVYEYIHTYFIPRLQFILEEKENKEEQLESLGSFFLQLLEFATAKEVINFSTAFSRITFLKPKFSITGRDIYLLQLFRQVNEGQIVQEDIGASFDLAKVACELLLHYVSQKKYTRPDTQHVVFPNTSSESTEFWYHAHGLVFQKKNEYFFIKQDGEDEVYCLSFENAIPYKSQVARFFAFGYNFLHVTLIQVNVDGEQKVLLFQSVTINPNYLLDVTAIADVYKVKEILPQSFFLKKFNAVPKSIPILLGNIANQILDSLIQDPNVSIRDIMLKLFQQNPIQFLSLNDDTLQKVMTDAKMHFSNLKKVLFNELPRLSIDIRKCYTEPSFLSNVFGIQGRLDVLYQSDDFKQNNIIELKSGSSYGANAYGISKNHYVQTLLYDLMIGSAYGRHANASNYILYSKEKNNALRYAPTVKKQQMEAIWVRNNLLYLEYVLQRLDQDKYFEIFSRILASASSIYDRFINQDLTNLKTLIESLPTIELHYLRKHLAFIAREHGLAKIGKQSFNNNYGFANLWMQSEQEKIEKFTILTQLVIVQNGSSELEPIIGLKKTARSNKLSKFRTGDIVILYPAGKYKAAPLNNQLFKASLIAIDKNSVILKLRNHQYNQAIFEGNTHWNIESDFLDSGFNRLYRNMIEWASMSESRRQISLGLVKPETKVMDVDRDQFIGVTDQQAQLLQQIISSKDYFLLWGPPGTGKTSIIVRELSRHYWSRRETILLLAYTNRAVDELCEAVSRIDPQLGDRFIRVGSRYACSEKYRKNLLGAISSETLDRVSFIKRLQSCRIYISTVSSILGQDVLFDLVKFETIVIDEASQLLEPMVLPLFNKANRLVFIGDHKQLPAVVQQNDMSDKHEVLAQSIGFNGCHLSLFERLLSLNRKKGWTDNIGALTYQGRMHERIMSFPSKVFYEEQLQALPSIDRLIMEPDLRDDMDLFTLLRSKRVVFINTQTDLGGANKTNKYEAEVVRDLIDIWLRGQSDNLSDLGVITLFRAQIALIDQEISEMVTSEPVVIDTVERFQGGARDVILFSMCTNDSYQFDRRIQMEAATIDKKFNVAITRARELLVIIGNEKIMRRYPLYENWINQAERVNLEIINNFKKLGIETS